MCIIIVSLLIKTPHPNPPASILIPAKGLYVTGFYTYDRRTNLPHHIMSQMIPLISIASGHSKIIIITVWEASGYRMKGFQPVTLLPGLSICVVFCGHFDLILSYHASQNRCICLLIIREIFQLPGQVIHGLPILHFLPKLLHILKDRPVIAKITSGMRCRPGKLIDPANVRICAIGVPVVFISLRQRKFGYIKIHPVNIVFFLLSGSFRFCHGSHQLFSLACPIQHPGNYQYDQKIYT